MNKPWAAILVLVLLGSATSRAKDNPLCCPPPGLTDDTPNAFDPICEDRFFEGFYADGGYLIWWLKRQPLPPLVTVGDPTVGNPSGALGQPGTKVIFGDASYSTGAHNGGRLTLGYTAQGYGIQLNYFGLEQRSRTFTASTTDTGALTQVLGRPFQDEATRAENFLSVGGLPPPAIGVVSVLRSSRFQGGEVNLTSNWLAGGNYRFTFLSGLRLIALDESLRISDSQNLAGAAQYDQYDRFATRNRYYAGQVGFEAERHNEWFGIAVIGKLGIGANAMDIRIDGASDILGRTSTTVGALLAQPSNIGAHHYARFALAPELDVRLSYLLSSTVKLNIGYTFLDINNVVRPGGVIDRTVSNFTVPGNTSSGPRPAFNRSMENFWVHGLEFGVTVGF